MHLNTPLGLLGLFFVLVVPFVLSILSGVAAQKMLRHRKKGARGFRYLIDQGAFLETDRYEEEALPHRDRAVKLRTWIWISVAIGFALLYLS